MVTRRSILFYDIMAFISSMVCFLKAKEGRRRKFYPKALIYTADTPPLLAEFGCSCD